MDERIHLSFLPRDFGVQRGQFTFEGDDPRDKGGRSSVANFRSASQSFLPAVRSEIEKVVAGTFDWARMKVIPDSLKVIPDSVKSREKFLAFSAWPDSIVCHLTGRGWIRH
ncbi:MAG: hypothetical protein CR217_03185 [Beijerinckiaceae bacterium]|nr:MAG: hypothetical protein CR217_03185 [Beijerinckiaceae bacterium]